MKRILILAFLSFLFITGNAQTSYYKGEWTTVNSKMLFTGIFKITIDKQIAVSGTMVWTYLAVDSADAEMVEIYKGKKGKKGIEYVKGDYNTLTHDMVFEGYNMIDPDLVIGTDRYQLKLSSDSKVLYGTTSHGGKNDGYFYAVKVDPSLAEKQINEVSRILIKKMN